jgi:hypothetical protein
VAAPRTEPKPVGAPLIAASPELTVSGDRLRELMLQCVFEHVGNDSQLEGLQFLATLLEQPGFPRTGRHGQSAAAPERAGDLSQAPSRGRARMCVCTGERESPPPAHSQQGDSPPDRRPKPE